jgi:hypothetical protein
VELDVDETIHAIAFRDPLDHVPLVKRNAVHKIAGDSNIERAVPLTGEDVDCRALLSHPQIPTIIPGA